MKEYTVPDEYGGTRLDRFVAKAARPISKGAVEKWIRTGSVRVNGKRSKAAYRLAAGDKVSVYSLMDTAREAMLGSPKRKPKQVKVPKSESTAEALAENKRDFGQRSKAKRELSRPSRGLEAKKASALSSTSEWGDPAPPWESDEPLSQDASWQVQEGAGDKENQGIKMPKSDVLEKGQLPSNGAIGPTQPSEKWPKVAFSELAKGTGLEQKPLRPQALLPPAYKGITIAYEDERVLVLYKPAGVLSHPDGTGRPSVSEALSYFIKEDYSGLFSPAVANRLDFNTTGLILAAKTPAMQRKLSGAADVKKSYLAIVAGVVSYAFSVESSADKDDDANMALESAEGKLQMKTAFSPIFATGEASLVKATLTSGKTHQVRFQLARLSHPLLGDRKYFSEESKALTQRYNASHQMLHCYSIEIPGMAAVSCPPPGEFVEALTLTGLWDGFAGAFPAWARLRG